MFLLRCSPIYTYDARYLTTQRLPDITRNEPKVHKWYPTGHVYGF